MTIGGNNYEGLGNSTYESFRFGFYSAIATAVLTVITFGLAITAIPVAGGNCTANCVPYPYLNTVGQFPKDYLWMPFAILMILAYVTLMVSIHAHAPGQKKIYSQVGQSFALMSATVLASIYFIQFSVIPVSLMNNETQGLPLLIQYNPHGVFIAMEEIGYLIMSLSFLFMAPVFAHRSRLEAAVRWIFIGAFLLAIVSLAGYSMVYGLERKDHYEIAIISINFLVLIINGVLLSLVFRKRMGEEKSRHA